MHRTFVLSLVGLLFLCPRSFAGPEIPDDVRAHVRALVDEKICTGVIVGVVDAGGATFFSQGRTALKDGQAIGEETIFEIGSISKVFTSILLCDQVESGKVGLDDAIQKYVPDGVKIPQRGTEAITFRSLAQHRSGLPRMPDNFNPADPENPYVDYREKDLFAFLSGHTLGRDVGEKYEYSNLATGLLGHLLTRIAGKPYEQLLLDRVVKPMGLQDTCLRVSAEKGKRFADGHSGGMQRGHWDFDCIAGAGAIRSSARDMLRFLEFNMGLKSCEIDKALNAAQAPRTETGVPDLDIALGWHVWKKHGSELIWHNGGTYGFHSFCGFRKDKRLGVVVLVNDTHNIDAIGLHLLEPKYELKEIQKSVKVEPKILDSYAGWYLSSPSGRMEITRTDDGLRAKLGGQEAVAIHAVSETRFIYRVVDAAIDFERDDQGKPTALVIHQNGQSQRFERAPADFVPPGPRKEVDVAAEILNLYAGQYTLMPGLVFDVKVQGGHLAVQLTGQPRIPVFAESETKFFYKVVDAQLTFVKDDDGKVVALILHQNGMDQRAERTQ